MDLSIKDSTGCYTLHAIQCVSILILMDLSIKDIDDIKAMEEFGSFNPYFNGSFY